MVTNMLCLEKLFKLTRDESGSMSESQQSTLEVRQAASPCTEPLQTNVIMNRTQGDASFGETQTSGGDVGLICVRSRVIRR